MLSCICHIISDELCTKKIKTSAIDALDSLKSGYKVKLFDKKNNFEWDLIVPLKPKQKDILGALDVVYKN